MAGPIDLEASDAEGSEGECHSGKKKMKKSQNWIGARGRFFEAAGKAFQDKDNDMTAVVVLADASLMKAKANPVSSEIRTDVVVRNSYMDVACQRGGLARLGWSRNIHLNI